ncbi:MAG: HYR domain-containing protein [Paraglaciecola sp.]|nr:HYR domain-containing protein [Paraglaciecola sp.]
MPYIKHFILLLAVTLICPLVFASVGLTPSTGTPYCGAIQDGQDLCGTGPAIFESNAIGVCPEGTFADVGRWGCYTCPDGFDRGIAAVDSDRACTREKTTDPLERFVSAKQVGTACPEGSFFDPVREGECFSCPSGYIRSAAHIDWPDACVILPEEVFSSVTEHGSGLGALGLDCAIELIITDEPPFIIFGPEQFWDGIDGNCHSCPTDFPRTGYSVHDSRACSMVIAGSQKYAKIEGQAQCLDGEITDFLTNPEQGGNCYSCPAGYDRTLFSVNSAQACETTPELEFSVATKTDDLTCPANQIFDFISTRHPDVIAKLSADGVSSDSYDSNDLGTCWTCPPGATRSWSSVTQSDACVLADVGWNMPTYNHVGLFGLEGATDVVLDIINEKDVLTTLAAAYAATSEDLSNDTFTDDVWQEISDNPQTSSLLALAVYARLQNFATSSSLQAHERAFLQDFQQQVTDYRSAMAQEALNILRVWQEGAFLRYIDPRFNNRPEIVLQKAFWLSIGVVSPPISPPDFSALIYEFANTPEVDPVVLAMTAAEHAIDQGVLTTLMPNNVIGDFSTSVADKLLDELLSRAEEEIIDAIERQILRTAANNGVKASAQMIIFGPNTLGPQIAVALFLEYATQWVEFIAGATDAEPKLKANLAQAQQIYSVLRQLETVPGTMDLRFNYKTIMNSSVQPSAADKLKIEQAVATRIIFTLDYKTSSGGTVDISTLAVNNGATSSVVNAISNDGYVFTHWTDSTGAEVSTSAALTISNVSASQTYTANFSLGAYVITTTSVPLMGGSVICSPNPVGHSDESSCTATALSGYLFANFSGDCTGATCHLTAITADKTVTANFELIVGGSCGSSHGTVLTEAPSSNLCDTGTASSVTGSGPWTWSCTDQNSGSNLTCSSLPIDSSAPVLLTPSSIEVAAIDQNGTLASNAAIKAFLLSATASDSIDGAVVVIHDGPATFPLGTTVVTFKATNSSGATASDQANVTISDQTAPVVIAPVSIEVAATEQNGAQLIDANVSAFLAEATANDNVDGALALTHNSPAIFPIGLTVVTFTATDNSGNTDSAEANVTVVDAPPEVTPPADLIINATALLTPTSLGTATATDTVDGTLTASTLQTGPFTSGLHTITWTATDSNDNIGEATQTLRVRPLANFGFNQKADNEGGAEVVVEVFLNGTAADYPVTIPFTVGGAASNPVDHDLAAGNIVIHSGNTGSVTFNLVDNDDNVNGKTITLTMDALNNAAIGTRNVHLITLSETNEAPRVVLTLDQGGLATNSIAITGNGNIVATASVIDPNTLDTHSYDWTNTHEQLVDLDANDNIFTFDPSPLTPGVYHLAVSVMDNANPPLISSSVIRVLIQASEPVLSSSADSDGDGTDDASEGYGDADNDGVPDYLDAIGALNVLSGQTGNSKSFLMETNPGLHLQLGSFAIGSGSGQVNSSDIESRSQSQADTITNIGGIFDFEISELPIPGQTIDLVMPQLAPVPESPVYRKFIGDSWFDFIENGTDNLASTQGTEGYCPPPDDIAYTAGLTPGHWCVKVTIMDGGPNDADGEANNRIVDPGGVGTSQPTQVVDNNSHDDSNKSTSDGGALYWWGLVFLGILTLICRLNGDIRKN